MNDRPIPVVGQRLIRVEKGFREEPARITSAIVSKVGRKYFTVTITSESSNYICEEQYHLDSWCLKSEYSTGLSLYPDEQEYRDEVEKGELLQRIRQCFGSWSNPKLTLKDARDIMAIIERSSQ